MRVSIITAVYNKLECSRKFHVSLTKYPPACDWSLLWIDNGSTDGTREWLKSLSPNRNHVVFNDQNLGYAAGNNIGANISGGDVLILLNNDLILTANWLDPLSHSLKSIERAGIIGNIQLQPATGRIDHAGVCYDLIGRPDHYLKGRRLSAARGPGRFSNAVTAACCMIRRDLFLSVGGFDERFRNGCEDVDLCLRLGQKGYRHWVDYRSVVYHHVSASPGRKDHDLQNQALFLQRWGHLTSKWGQKDWPGNYLSKHLHNPTRLNGTKTLDAILRLLRLKHGDSKWAAQMRQRIMAAASPPV
ncbi:glycosyltransferase [Termitidicoccus mucosus]|uniref:glycosyltransferase family 2 protein n=1 Tax=Termitidicoccus mucosus TaxID=1184151 RepID=UPI000A079686